jgi:rod shape-determining protein MreC
MLKRPHYTAAGLVVLMTLIVLNLSGQTAARIKLAIGSLFLPLFGLTNSSQELADKAGDALTPRSRLLKENEDLRRENSRLQIEAMQARDLALENSRLRQQLRWQEQSPWKNRLRPARVVLDDPSNLWRSIWINIGRRDGVRTNMPVLTPQGLVGRIECVALTRSQVVLVGDSNCKVAAQVEDTRDPGIIGANRPFDSSLVPMDYLSRDAKPGQRVVTSGDGEIFPKGIVIGQIVDSHPVEYGLYIQARVKLAANLSGLEEVWVLFP